METVTEEVVQTFLQLITKPLQPIHKRTVHIIYTR